MGCLTFCSVNTERTQVTAHPCGFQSSMIWFMQRTINPTILGSNPRFVKRKDCHGSM